ncbi:DsbA family protein [Candidatus Nomurabacteria bacterium]|nr:DsbA family protein [Candidatus Nomurabacteria bacterium]
MQNNQQIAGAIIIAGLIIGGAVLLKGNNSVSGTKPEDAVEKIQPVDKTEHILGNPNAKVMIVEYSDTECPYCKMFHATMHEVIKQREGKVAWVYRHYPITQLHQKAFREAEATECAWEQGGNDAFWKYVDEIYVRTQSNDTLDVKELPKIAEFVGLDVAAFNTCLESGKYTEKVQNHFDSGFEAGVRGTPRSVILKNGKVVYTINGAQYLETVLEQVDKALK